MKAGGKDLGKGLICNLPGLLFDEDMQGPWHHCELTFRDGVVSSQTWVVPPWLPLNPTLEDTFKRPAKCALAGWRCSTQPWHRITHWLGPC